MADIIQHKRGISERWTAINYPLRTGEIGIETDTGKFKVGDGTTPWNDLPYYVDEDAVSAMIATAIAELGAGEFDPRVGDLTTLTTTEKGTIVGAINEVNTPSVAFTLLYDNAKA